VFETDLSYLCFRLRMRPNVVLKQLSINVGSSDQSYMPQHVVVTAGRDEQNLREISDCRIPRYYMHPLWTLAQNKNSHCLTYMHASFCARLENLRKGESHIKGMGVLMRNFENNPWMRGTKILFWGHGFNFLHPQEIIHVPIVKQHLIYLLSYFFGSIS